LERTCRAAQPQTAAHGTGVAATSSAVPPVVLRCRKCAHASSASTSALDTKANSPGIHSACSCSGNRHGFCTRTNSRNHGNQSSPSVAPTHCTQKDLHRFFQRSPATRSLMDTQNYINHRASKSHRPNPRDDQVENHFRPPRPSLRNAKKDLSRFRIQTNLVVSRSQNLHLRKLLQHLIAQHPLPTIFVQKYFPNAVNNQVICLNDSSIFLILPLLLELLHLLIFFYAVLNPISSLSASLLTFSSSFIPYF
jgi:hypothetical protein